jgi:hypothetical protein
MLTINEDPDLARYRDAFEQMALGAIVVRRAVSETDAAAIRKRLSGKSFAQYRLVHLGHFAYTDEVDEPALRDGVLELAEHVTQTRLSVAAERCYRLVRGDYVLSRLDHDIGFEEGARAVDVIVDLSESSSGEAQVVYAHKGEHFFAAPQLSRSIALVERRPSVTRYHRYLNHKTEGRVIYRYTVTLARGEQPRPSQLPPSEAPPSSTGP